MSEIQENRPGTDELTISVCSKDYERNEMKFFRTIKNYLLGFFMIRADLKICQKYKEILFGFRMDQVVKVERPAIIDDQKFQANRRDLRRLRYWLELQDRIEFHASNANTADE